MIFVNFVIFVARSRGRQRCSTRRLRIDHAGASAMLSVCVMRTNFACVGANAIVTREAADIRELRPDCPEGLAELLSDCLRLDASRRPLTADDVTARLEAIAC